MTACYNPQIRDNKYLDHPSRSTVSQKAGRNILDGGDVKIALMKG
jgi:hypothetical protein